MELLVSRELNSAEPQIQQVMEEPGVKTVQQ